MSAIQEKIEKRELKVFRLATVGPTMCNLWRRIHLKIKLFYRGLLRFLINSFNPFFLNLDAITNCDSIQGVLMDQKINVSLYERIKQNIYYLFALLIITLTQLDSFVICARANLQYSFEGMQSLLSRKIAPPKMWFQADCAINIGITIEWFVYALLSLRAEITRKFKMYAIGSCDRVRIFSNGKYWNKDCSEKVLQFRKRARQIIGVCIMCGMNVCWIYWGWNAYQNSTGTWRDVLIIGYLPLFGFISNFGVAIQPFFIALCIRYFKIRQSGLVTRIESFTSGMTRRPSKQRNAAIWRHYCVINRDILRLNVELRAYSTHWSPYLTVIFVGYITLVTMLLYGMIIHTENDSAFNKSFFIFYAFECMAVLLTITGQCAIIVRNNVAIFRANRTFCYAYSRLGQPNAC